jgi:hypothetical protein
MTDSTEDNKAGGRLGRLLAFKRDVTADGPRIGAIGLDTPLSRESLELKPWPIVGDDGIPRFVCNTPPPAMFGFPGPDSLPLVVIGGTDQGDF